MSATKPRSKSTKKDFAQGKRFPNSLSAIISCMCDRWAMLEGDDSVPTSTSPKFVEHSNFADTYLEVAKRYPAASAPALRRDTNNRPIDVDNDRLPGTLNSLIRGDEDLSYVKLRAVANTLGVSDSVVLMFGMLTSLDRRIDDNTERTKAMTEFLDAIDRVIVVMRNHTQLHEGKKEVFSDVHRQDRNGNDVWIAEPKILRAVMQAYNEEPMPAYDKAVKMK